MKSHPLVIKMSLLTAGLNKVQLADLLSQMKARDYTQITAWFQAQNNPLTVSELEHLQGKRHPAYTGVMVVNWLTGVWRRNKRVAFIADAVRDDLRPIRAMVIDKAIVAGESEDYGKDAFLDALKSLVKELSNG
jgi:hypothetical protein